MTHTPQRGPILESYQGHHPCLDPEGWAHPSAVLIGDVVVGPHSSLWPHTTLRGDDGPIRVGARTSVQDGTVVHATEDLSETRIAEQVTVGHNCTIHGAQVDHDTIVGMGSILLDNAQIGPWCIIGAGSLVTQRTVIPEGSLALGSPAKVVRPLSDRERDWITYSWKRYVEQVRLYRQRDASPAGA